jgi:prepilin-type N-terminal cleavage/methylation domain-containing protein
MTDTRQPTSSSGFSLIELIITILVAGIFGAILAGFFNPLARIADPLQFTDNVLKANEVMARIVAHYEAKGIGRGAQATLATFMSGIGTAGETRTNKYGTYTVAANAQVVDAAANNPWRLTIAVNGRSVTTLFACTLE